MFVILAEFNNGRRVPLSFIRQNKVPLFILNEDEEVDSAKSMTSYLLNDDIVSIYDSNKIREYTPLDFGNYMTKRTLEFRKTSNDPLVVDNPKEKEKMYSWTTAGKINEYIDSLPYK